jgi:hypothetical protein
METLKAALLTDQGFAGMAAAVLVLLTLSWWWLGRLERKRLERKRAELVRRRAAKRREPMPVVGQSIVPAAELVPEPVAVEIVEEVAASQILSERTLLRRLANANNTIEELLAELSIREEPDRILRLLLSGPMSFTELQRALQVDTAALRHRVQRLQWITEQVELCDGSYWLVPSDVRQARALGVAV